jgi:hypothetical protein
VRNKLRPHLRDVNRTTTTSCGPLEKEHHILRNYSHLQQLRWDRAVGLGSGFSTSVPPLIRQFSTAFPQAFAQGRSSGFPRKSTGSSHDLRCFFVAKISIRKGRIFISFFVRFPRESGGLSRIKKGVIGAESEVCGKSRPGWMGAQDVVVAEASAHTMWHVEQFSLTHRESRPSP